MKKTMYNRALDTQIIPNIISDHHMIALHVLLSHTTPHSYFWRFDTKLLLDHDFCKNFKQFWSYWITRTLKDKKTGIKRYISGEG